MGANSALVKIFSELAVLMDMKGVQFKPRAFEKAAHSLEAFQEDVRDVYKHGGRKALEAIPGVGPGIADRIEEHLKTGRIKEYDRLKKQLPVDIEGLRSVEGVGPKTILLLYRKLKIKNRAQLEKAARAGRLAKVPGLGKKTEQNVLRGIQFLKEGTGRQLLYIALPLAQSIVEKLQKVPGVQRVEFAGSLRRMQETIGDIDLLAIAEQPKRVLDAFASLSDVKAVYSTGPTKVLVRLKIGIDADLLVLTPESFGAALQYFTGDKYHNIELRQIAIKKGYKLNEFGLFKGKRLAAGRTEEEIYKKLGFEWMPPEIRTNSGELAAAGSGKLPRLIGYDDLKGDMQVQTDWTDGENSIEQMAKAAVEAGLEYICITDHTEDLAMTGGSDEKQLLKQMAEIDKVQKRFPELKILKGAEVNIRKDGTLDIEDRVLAKLDVVGASVHSHFHLPEKEQTARLLRVIENPHVDIVFHPTGRVIQRREPVSVDMDALLKAAKRTGTVMEIDAYPDRLDLKDEYVRKAVQLGVKMSIDSDAHSTAHFQYLKYGIAQARRGWAEKKDIINTRNWKEMLKLLK